jgi:hypothetical protein
MYAVEMGSGGMTYVLISMTIGSSHLINITVITATILQAMLFVLLFEGIYEAVQITSCGMIYVRSFMKTGIDVDFQVILRFCLRNLRLYY